MKGFRDEDITLFEGGHIYDMLYGVKQARFKMKYPQALIDNIWKLECARLSVSKIAKIENLKNEQVRYVLKHKSPSKKFICVSDEIYYIDADGNPQIETPEANILKSIVQGFKDFYK